MNPIRKILESRKNHITTLAVGNGLIYGASFPIVYYIREHSTSVILNMIFIMLWMALLFALSYLEGILVGDLLFSKTWKERFILLNRVDADKELEAGEGAFKEYRYTFFFSIFLLIIGNYLLSNAIHGGFFNEYKNQGYGLTRLRHKDAAVRRKGIMELRLAKTLRVESAMVKTLKDPDGEARAMAAWVLGYQESKASAKALLVTLKDKYPLARAEAAFALGRINHGPAIPLLRRELVLAPAEYKHYYILALGMMRDKGAIPLMAKLLSGPETKLHPYAAWSLARTKSPTVIGPLLTAMAGELGTRCAAVEAQWALSHVHSAKPLTREFDRSGAKTFCKDLIFKNRGFSPIPIVRGEIYRVKLLRALGHTASAQIRPWLKKLMDNPSYHWQIRAMATGLYKNLR